MNAQVDAPLEGKTAPSVLFQWPDQAAFGEGVAKSKVAAASPARGLKERLRTCVASIEWAWKLAPISLNVASSPQVREIQVFRLALKPGVTSKLEPLLRGIDQAIPSPIVFELTGDAGVCTVAAYKRPSEADAGKNVLGDYLWGRWLAADTPRQSLPTALDMGIVYRELLRALIPLPARTGETLREQLDRLARVRVLQRECARLEAQLTREKQFNRKVEINRALRGVRQALQATGN